MPHHIVTVCVVCVLCTAHVPCSAHTNLSEIVYTSYNSTTHKNSSSSDTEIQSAWMLIKPTEITYSKDQYMSYPNNFNNKLNTITFGNSQYINNSDQVTVNAMSTTMDDSYLKKKITENFKGSGKTRDTEPSIINVAIPVNSRDTELLQRLAQTELPPNVNRKSIHSSKDLRTFNESRIKRNIAVDEKYFMKKIFEAYGDGTSITIEGFERLVQKLGLLKLLTDISKAEDGSTDKNMHKNQLGNEQ